MLLRQGDEFFWFIKQCSLLYTFTISWSTCFFLPWQLSGLSHKLYHWVPQAEIPYMSGSSNSSHVWMFFCLPLKTIIMRLREVAWYRHIQTAWIIYNSKFGSLFTLIRNLSPKLINICMKTTFKTTLIDDLFHACSRDLEEFYNKLIC